MSLWNRTVVALETTSVVRGSGRAFLLDVSAIYHPLCLHSKGV